MTFQQRRADTPSSVADRIFAILESFGPDRSTQTLSEICQHTGLPAATTSRLLTKLAAWGALERQHGSFRYGIGHRLTELGALRPAASEPGGS